MNEQELIIVYKSVTGFTEAYAKKLSHELGCALISLEKATSEQLKGFDTIVFGSRLHAGMIDGLKAAKELFSRSGAKKLFLFFTGASPESAKEAIEQMWKNNLVPLGLDSVPHFYFPGGLNYERMPLGDKLMMKVFRLMMKRKKGKDEYEQELSEAIGCSYDISSEEYLLPLVALLKKK